MKITFKDHITSVICEPKTEAQTHYVLDTRSVTVGYKYRIFPIKETKTGLFSASPFSPYDYICSVEEFNTRNEFKYFEDGNFYYKPRILINMDDGKFTWLYFDTEQEMWDYAEELKQIGPHIITE